MEVCAMILQSTLNRHVNGEAVAAYIDIMPEMANRISEYGLLRELSAKERYAIAALHSATGRMRDALELAMEARRLSDEISYDRLYGRVEA
jgi:hypothetical protein